MLSVVVPAFNEDGAIAQTVDDIRAAARRMDSDDIEIIVVDDGSDDATADIAEKAGATVIRKPQNMGYGHSLKVGISAARHEIIAITDADGTYPIDKLPELVALFNEGFDMVIGARTGEHYRESIIKSPLRKVLSGLVGFTVGAHVPDANSGLRVFRKSDIMPLFPHLSDSFSFTTSSTLAYMMKHKYVRFVPVPYHERVGVTKVRLFRDSLRTFQYIIQAIVHYNPIKLFLAFAALIVGMGCVLATLGAAYGSMTLVFLGGLAWLVSLLVFAIGLLAEQIRTRGNDNA